MEKLQSLLNLHRQIITKNRFFENFVSSLYDYIFYNSIWNTGHGDALLVLDKNGDGIINDAGELFGNYTKNSDGTYARSGYQALNDYDSNNDGVIDANDERFGELKLWTDANQDGVTDTGELKTLTEAGITSLNISTSNYTPTDGVYFDMDGNGVKEKMTTWTAPNEWMVIKDINGDGKITSGKEVERPWGISLHVRQINQIREVA